MGLVVVHDLMGMPKPHRRGRSLYCRCDMDSYNKNVMIGTDGFVMGRVVAKPLRM